MSRMILSAEQIEKEAQALADYKNKKMQDIEKFIQDMDNFIDKELDNLLKKFESKAKEKMLKLLDTKELEKLAKEMGVVEEKPKQKRGRKKKTVKDLKEVMVKEMKRKLMDLHNANDDDNYVEIKPKRRGPGRPKGSKNKPKNIPMIVSKDVFTEEDLRERTPLIRGTRSDDFFN